METKFLSIPENDPRLRYILGNPGKNNLLTICLNPSTANAYKHDGTTNNVEKIAWANGYDGWVLFNLSPERTSNPDLMSLEYSKNRLIENQNLLEGYVLRNQETIKGVLLAWGDNIVNLRGLLYLRESAYHILDRLKKYDLQYYCIKQTGKGHPFHPAAQGINRYVGKVEEIKLQPFDADSYSRQIR